MTKLNLKKIAIIAGGGELPNILLNSIKKTDITPHVIIIEDHADGNYSQFPNIKLKLGQFNKAIKYLQQNNIDHICFAGKIYRPSLSQLKLDTIGVKFLAKIGLKKLSGGDDQLLQQIINLFEQYRISTISPVEICKDLVINKGVIGEIKPSKQDLEDIRYGEEILDSLSRFDIGQAIIIENKYTLGIEAAEGTDELIKRIKSLKKEKNLGVFVKKPKLKQNMRIDLPTIGIETINNVINSNLKGIAISANTTLIIDKKAVIAKANKNNIFIFGI